MNRYLSSLSSAVVLTGGMLSALPAQAHIRLLKPASWVEEDGLGDPQKDGPCGTASDSPPEATGAVTSFGAGEKISVEWEVTIPHPGWYRIALVKDRSELADPDVQPDVLCNVDPQSVPTTPHGNVLADGLYMDSSETEFSHEVTLPEEPCEKCTLQVIQYMTLHTQPCIYYHCADIKIAGGSGEPSTGDAGATTGNDAGTVRDAGSSAGATTDASSSNGGADAGADAPEEPEDDDAEQARVDAGKDSSARKDAGAKRDASSNSSKEEDEDQDGDEAEDEDEPATAEVDDGCRLASAGSDLRSGSTLLLVLGALLVNRRRRAR